MSINQQQVIDSVSTLNSSTANLASSAAFTGTADGLNGISTIKVTFNTSQNCTVQVQQSEDGTNWDINDSYTTTANIGDARVFQAVASYVRVIVTNNGASTTTFLRLQTDLSPVVQEAPRSLSQAGNYRVAVQEPIPAGSNNIGSVNQGTSPWITQDTSDGPVTPGTVAQKSALVGGQFNATLPKLSSGQQSALQTDARGRIYANSRQPPGTLDVFGTTTSAPRQLQIDIQFFNGILSSLVNLTIVGTGSGTLGSGNALFSTGTGATSQCLGTSTETVAYASGCEIFAHFTAAFTTPTSSASYQRIGLYNSSNGFYIGYTGTSFVVAVRNNGVDTSIAQASWNMDTLTGAAGSLFTRNGLPEAVDFTKANVWRIRFGWLGSAPIYFEVLAPDGEWVTFHKIQQPNTSASPSIANPNLPITIDVNKTSSDATNLSIATACWGAGVTFASNVLEDPQTYEYINVDRRSELRTATSVMLIGAVQAGSILDTNMWTSTSVGSGTNTVSNAVVILSTGTTANSSSTLSSIFRARFIPGTVNAFHAQVRVPDTGVTNNVRQWGAYNANNGVFFQLNGTTPGIGVRFAGTDTIVTSLNGPYKYVLDTNFHTYEIQYTAENAYFYQDNKLIHTYNSLTTALTANPHLFLGFESTNSGGGTINAPLYVGCSSIMRYGEANARPRYFHPVYTSRIQTQSAATTAGATTLTISINPTKAGNLLAVAATAIKDTLTITDNLSQTYSTAAYSTDGTDNLYIFYVQNTLANVTSITITSPTNSAMTLLVAEYSNIATTGAFDKNSNLYNPGVTSFTSGLTSATTQSNELLIGAATDVQHNNTTYLAGTNWTSVLTKGNTGAGGNLTGFLEEQYVTNIGTYAATGTSSQTANILAAIATFKIANNALSNGFTIINSPTTITIGAGTLRKVIINSIGTAGANVTFYDNITNSGNVIAVLSLSSTVDEISYDLDFSNGLTMVVNSPSADFTVVYD